MTEALLLAAAATACGVDWATARRGWTPPAFRLTAGNGWSLREVLALLLRGACGGLLAIVLWLAVFAPVASWGSPAPAQLDGVHPAQLFALHVAFLLALAAWVALGYWTALPARPRVWMSVLRRQLGLGRRGLGRELALGVVAGVAGWAAVMLLVAAVIAGVAALGHTDWLQEQPDGVLLYLLALPWGLRLALAVSAGVAEELLFRGFLQPRIGVLASTLLFVLAHASYGQAVLLVGVTFLSFLFAGLVRWRRGIGAAIAAHAVFDAIQLLVVLPVLHRYGL